MNTLPTESEFSAELKTVFKVRAAEQSFEMTLVEVKSIVSNEIQDCFTLLFAAPLDAPAVQQIFQIEHNTLGKIEIFLVPVKKTENELLYEAVFNKTVA